jgi:phosphate-selective porin OprO and OprP
MTRKVVRRGAVALLALVLSLAAGAGAWAQGLFYAEETKDGRIFVFNIKANYERWKASGETGTGLTRLNVGPNGETVYADNETALELFFFKHGIKEVVPKPAAPVQTIVWRDGKTRMTLGDNFYMELSNRVQARYTHDFPDDSITRPGTAAAGDSVGSFRIRRAKLKFEGWVAKPYITYEVQANWPAVTGANVGAILEDAVLDWDVTKGKGQFRIGFGQFKPAFAHQELTSSGNQSFVDRSEVSNQYARGRDTGLRLWGQFNNKIEWRFSIMNGNGLTRTTNDNDQFQYNARVVWQPNGLIVLNQRPWVTGALYSEADFESTDKPIFALAANWEKNNFHRTTTAIDLKDNIYGFDGVFKYKRFFATGEYYIRERTPEAPATGAPQPKFNSDGWFAQATYLLNSKRTWEVAARIGQFDPTDLREDNLRKEIRGGISYYYLRHSLKVQADYGQLEDEAANSGRGTKNKEFRLQTQIVF